MWWFFRKIFYYNHKKLLYFTKRLSALIFSEGLFQHTSTYKITMQCSNNFIFSGKIKNISLGEGQIIWKLSTKIETEGIGSYNH